MSIITIATDYSSPDGYTAAMIGVIKSIAPQSEIFVVTEVLEGVTQASLALMRYYHLYPRDTIHLVVVDPTVGTSRRAIVGSGNQRFFVGPDNGVFSRVIESHSDSNWHEIDIARLPAGEISNTFHGRDIFAPAAALLSQGRLPADFGPEISIPTIIRLPEPVISPGRIEGEIIDVDSFGNLIINIRSNLLGQNPRISIKEHSLPFVKTFADVKPGFPLAYIGSLGFLEIGVNLGRADEFFKAGSKIVVEL